jgi:hypothetical protein
VANLIILCSLKGLEEFTIKILDFLVIMNFFRHRDRGYH